MFWFISDLLMTPPVLHSDFWTIILSMVPSIAMAMCRRPQTLRDFADVTHEMA
eukprot:jgi/Psemu1/301930/fgenesh1_kg.51_\